MLDTLPGRGVRLAALAHSGQPVGLPLQVRWKTEVLQVLAGWCLAQRHTTFCWDEAVTSAAVRSPLPSVSHSAASSGLRAAKELHAHGRWPEQTGQLLS